MIQPTIAAAAADLAAGPTAAALVEEALSRIADPVGEGSRAFVAVQASEARASAAAMDALRAGRPRAEPLGRHPDQHQGPRPKGVVTRGGSVALDDRRPRGRRRYPSRGWNVLASSCWGGPT